MITELQESENNIRQFTLSEYKLNLQKKIKAYGKSLAIMENEHLHMQLRNSIPSNEQFWINRISALLEIAQKECPDVMVELLGY